MILLQACALLGGVAVLRGAIGQGRRLASTEAIALALTRPRRRGDSRLLRAMVPWDLTGWRRFGAAVAVSVALLLWVSGVALWVALSVALSITRGSGAIVLMARGHRLRKDCATADGLIARRIAVELSGGCGLAEAIHRASLDPPPTPAATALLRDAAARIALGSSVAEALASAAPGVGADPRAEATIRRVAGLVALTDAGGNAGARMLRRYADGVDADADAARQTRALATEARFVALALPVLTVGMALLIASLSARAAAAALSPVGVLVCGVAISVAGLGAAVVIRATAS